MALRRGGPCRNGLRVVLNFSFLPARSSRRDGEDWRVQPCCGFRVERLAPKPGVQAPSINASMSLRFVQMSGV